MYAISVIFTKFLLIDISTLDFGLKTERTD